MDTKSMQDHGNEDLFVENTSFPSLIERQAMLRPLKPCIASTEDQLNFAQFWRLITTSTARFYHQGVRRGSRVAVVAESSIAAIAAAVSVLRLGAIAIPLGPSLPESRIVAIAEICDLTHLVALTPLSQSLHFRRVQRLSHDLDIHALDDSLEYRAPPALDVLPNTPAIVLFTSGSTGKPKGVVHSHSSLSTMSLCVSKALHLGPGERNFLFPSFGWAVNIIDSFATMAGGACLCIPSEAEKSQTLESTINLLRATRMTVPSSVLGIIDLARIPHLSTLVLAGAPMTSDVIEPWLARVRIFWNYGSTETLMVLAGEMHGSGSEPINAGQALSCCRCWTVDDHDDMLRSGEIGQLVVESNTNLSGYIEGGIICQMETSPEQNVMVKPGDLFERRGPLFAYKGRSDFQLKLFGQRLDPLDVEHHLRHSLSLVDDVVVTVASPRGARGNPMLVAVVTLANQDSKEMQPCVNFNCDFEGLSQALPPYMVPSGALLVPSMPRLSNGKLDRQRIAHLVEEMDVAQLLDLRPDLCAQQVGRQDLELASKISLIWSKVLGLEPSGITLSTNFFMLGGNSIDAMRVCGEVRKLDLRVTASTLFANPTLGQLIRAITTGSNTARPSIATEVADPCQSPEERNEDVKRRIWAADQCSVEESMIENVYPCTPMQCGLVWGAEVQQGAYIAQHTFHLPSGWTQAAFIHAWHRVVQAVPMLRTRIVQHESGMFNVTLQWKEAMHMPLELFPLGEEMKCGQPFFLYRLHEREPSGSLTWEWRIHHALYDRWSTNLILDMTAKAYLDHQIPYSLPFSNFAKASSTQIASARSREYWRGALEGFAGMLYPQASRGNGACRASRLLEFSFAAQRDRLATTRATSLQAALALSIAKMQHETDVVFGMTVHGRDLPECPRADTVVGPLIATVPMRVQLDMTMLVGEFLASLQAKSGTISDHEHYGLLNIKRICPEAESAASFNTLLIIQCDAGKTMLPPPESIVEVDTVAVDQYLDYPLAIECEIGLTHLQVRIFHDPAVISPWDVQMLARVFRCAFEVLESDASSSKALGDLKLTSRECEKDLVRWSSGHILEYRECLDERIFKKATNWPEEPAIDGWDADFTYGQLSRLVHKLSLQLSWTLSLPVGTILPVVYEKSAFAIVAMLTVLKAGYGFLMLDPSLPAQRIQYMIQAVGSKTVLCSSSMTSILSDSGVRHVIFEDVIDATPVDSPRTIHIERSPEAPAYCMFTSGSTGAPKGVLMLHKQVTSGLEAQCWAGLYQRGTRILQFASYSFDTSIADIFATLLSGGCVCVPNAENHVARLAEHINHFAVDAVDLTPSVARTIQPNDVPNLKVLRLGGEPMHDSHVQAWSDRRLQSTYGPTEACVQCTFIQMASIDMNPLNIGKSIGCNTWIVDTNNHRLLAPVGAIGELAIQGPSVASGYVNDKTKTESVFLSHAPWLDTYGIQSAYCTYLTGDLVKFDSNGNILFVGRQDDQIKIRGQRVELGEIENVLQYVDAIERVAVCYPRAGAFALQLVAVVQPHLGGLPTTSAWSWKEMVKSKAAESLPRYMIPNQVLIRDEIPLTATGKLDRKRITQGLEQMSTDEMEALELSKVHSEGLSQVDDPTRNILTSIIEEIQTLLSWGLHDQEVISIKPDQSWSDIGLDSIKLVLLQKWINKEFQTSIDMRQLLSLDNAAGLAHYILPSNASGANARSSVPDAQDFEKLIDTGVDRLRSTPSSPLCIQHVLLTGATSLIGLNILVHLLHMDPMVRVVVLVRCQNSTMGIARLVQKLNAMTLWRQEFMDRIELWSGDLSQPHLGLSNAQLSRLAGTSGTASDVEAIIHSGAAVDWMKGFGALKAVNIDASLRLVECTQNSTSIRRHVHVSGGPQWNPREPVEMSLCSSSIAAMLGQSNAYGQTKLITSAIIQKAAACNPDLAQKVAVIRPGLVVGSSTDGIPNVDDYIWRVVMGCWRVGAFPDEAAQGWVYLCGADIFAKHVVDRLFAPPQIFETRIHDGLRVSTFWSVVNEELKAPLRSLDHGTWLQLINEDIASYEATPNGDSHPCLAISHMLESGPNVLGAVPPVSVTTEWMDKVEQEASIAVRQNVHYLKRVGYLTRGENLSSPSSGDLQVLSRRI